MPTKGTAEFYYFRGSTFTEQREKVMRLLWGAREDRAQEISFLFLGSLGDGLLRLLLALLRLLRGLVAGG